MARMARRWRVGLPVLVGMVAVAAAATAFTVSKRAQPPPTRAFPPPTRPAARPAPLTVEAVAPAAGRAALTPSNPIVVRFSAPLDRASPTPTLTPDLAGAWSRPDPTTFEFVPTTPPIPDQPVSLTIPAGPTGIRAADGAALTTPVTTDWTAAHGSILRLQQLLASLGYLPVAFQPLTPVPPTPQAETLAAYSPPSGSFPWRWPSVPPRLAAQWQPGIYGPMTRGAVMAFEAAHGLAPDGDAGPLVWSGLIDAVVAGAPTVPHYSWVEVSEGHPELLALWHDGKVALLADANTGVPAAPTPIGTWPVYARYPSTTMSGRNPDGTHYDDHGVPFVNYFNGGDAVHGFLRSQYGSPQSLGCVELPVAAAHQAYNLLYIGALVTVSPT